jgi:5-(carboxyamino)imidazole ribonucleotide synthase
LKPLRPGSTIGILGGGQLGRMIALEGAPLGYRFLSLDPSEDAPASQVGRAIRAVFGDERSELEFASRCDAVTLEWENVPAEVVERISALKPVFPSAGVLRTIQDRLVQRRFLASHGFPQTEFAEAGQEKFKGPSIVKTRRHGYDGKGQAAGGTPEAADLSRKQPCIVEKKVKFKKELSAIVARGQDGSTAVYPIAENVHRDGILHSTRAPADVPKSVAKRCASLALRIAEALDHVGVMAVELFWLGGDSRGALLVNEIAPRVHNSGHYTWGACAASQFEQHARAVAGLPLGSTAQHTPAVMLNLLGELWEGGEPRWEKVLARPDARLHLYGKSQPKPGRKMGHIVLLGDAKKHLAGADALLASLKR